MSDTKASEPTTTKEQTRTLAFPQVVNSSVTFLHQVAHFQVMFLNNSLFVWVGGADRTLDQLTSGVAWEKVRLFIHGVAVFILRSLSHNGLQQRAGGGSNPFVHTVIRITACKAFVNA